MAQTTMRTDCTYHAKFSHETDKEYCSIEHIFDAINFSTVEDLEYAFIVIHDMVHEKEYKHDLMPVIMVAFEQQRQALAVL